MTPIEAQIRECYGRVAYSHKSHEKTADILLWRMHAVKNSQILISAIVTGTLIGSIFETGKTAAIISAILSSVLLALNSYMKSYDIGSIAQKHVEAASKLWIIRESFLSLLTDLNSDLDNKAIIEKRDQLQKQLVACYQSAPRILPKAYLLAQKALQLNEELTFTDKEIDLFLPQPLRKSENTGLGECKNV